MSRLFAALALALALASACAPVRSGFGREAPLHGKVVFDTHCAPCHPGGNGGVGPSLDRPFTHAVLHAQVRLGSGNMPPFDENALDERDFEDLAEYLRALRAARLASR